VLLAYWWREYAECSAGPRGSLVESDDTAYLYKVEEEWVGVPVKGGLYEVCNLFSSTLYHNWIESCMDY
jgi:hypothetical protein